ncbi:MAG TPA: acetyl-CoA carboxylase biotin carboxylase subunit [Candidatus Eisenbacteria bacterium]
MSRPFKKVLVANRGEIAVRVMRALRELGIPSVAVYSEADRLALHVRMADEAWPVGPAPSRESYLVAENVLAAAKASGADAVHPGYGFLSENADFARKCREAGVTFIGPPPEAIEMMGNKVVAREAARKAGAPVVPGSDGPVADEVTAVRVATEIGYPVMLKAAAGGGGKGMRIVRSEPELRSALSLVKGEAASAFGDDEVYLEKYIERPRHIEVQVLFDGKGNGVHLGERECTIQRRHQKVVEEAPSPVITPHQREEMGEAALAIARAAGYVNAGTIEFIYAPDGKFYFLEMNTRLQVEHPVTELVYDVDLVKEQIHIAGGGSLRLNQIDLIPRGWAIECRIYAEDPYRGFLPVTGTIVRLRMPSGPGVRNDIGFYQGYEVPIYYDPMLAKLSVSGQDREEARRRMLRALAEYQIDGLKTTIPFHRWLLQRPEFQKAEFDTGTIDRDFKGLTPEVNPEAETAAMIAAVIHLHEGNTAGTTTGTNGDGEKPSAWKMAGRTGRWWR